jgi:hypothetical protein
MMSAAAYRLANRLRTQKDPPEVSVHLPEVFDRDWRDIWASSREQGLAA